MNSQMYTLFKVLENVLFFCNSSNLYKYTEAAVTLVINYYRLDRNDNNRREDAFMGKLNLTPSPLEHTLADNQGKLY